MAITTIGDIVTGKESVILSYMTEDPVEKTAFFQSGILTSTPYAAAIANGPSNKAVLPYWKAIDTSIEPNYSNDVYQDIATPRNVQTGEMMARVAYLNEGFGQADLTVAGLKRPVPGDVGIKPIDILSHIIDVAPYDLFRHLVGRTHVEPIVTARHGDRSSQQNDIYDFLFHDL